MSNINIVVTCLKLKSKLKKVGDFYLMQLITRRKSNREFASQHYAKRAAELKQALEPVK